MKQLRYFQSKKIKVLLGLTIALAIVLLCVFVFPGSANAEYLDFQTSKIFNPGDTGSSGSSNSNLWNGLVHLLEFMTTAILLPVGIILSAWRVVYLAVFPMMAHIDPLDMMRSGRYDPKKRTTGSIGQQSIVQRFFGGEINREKMSSSEGQSNTSIRGSKLDEGYFSGVYADKNCHTGDKITNESNWASQCIKLELGNMFIGFLITACVWVVLKVMMRLAVFMLDFFDKML